jgi:hypothetical protein
MIFSTDLAGSPEKGYNPGGLQRWFSEMVILRKGFFLVQWSTPTWYPDGNWK